MDFGEVLSKAWKIIWKFKILWIFGILSSCGQGGAGGGSGGGGTSGWRADSSNFDLPPGWERFFEDLTRFFENIQAWQIAALIGGMFLLILLISFIALLVSTLGRVGLVKGTLMAEAGAESMTFGEIFAEIKPFYWRILGFNFLIGLVFAALGLFVFLPLSLFGIITAGLGFLCILPLICVLVPLSWAFAIVIEQANIAIVAEDLSMMDGLKRGWDVFRENIANMLVMGLILGIGSVAVGIAMALPMFFIVVPVIFAIIGGTSGSDVLFGGGMTTALICFVAYLPVLIVLGGILQAYIKSAWTLTYLRLTGNAGADAALEEQAALEAPMPEENL